ncbi:MAG: tRNA (adenosine(37)-N6)-threonylcarbamoyltransferase complex dimerization subunit type 1 TsaB [Candidatus Hydrogenedentes bacterium]|nr:tRNA (adenosine(37)-N6)-threonylcarbamoyltransferase complex dimerization subunit type 1 TsaB [Candidatus Hydrogenedentota bacterium]
MMRFNPNHRLILSVDTATNTNTVALCQAGALLAEISINQGRRHAERLLALIDSLLLEASLRLESVDAFAVSAGPGSFTGLRIGVATLKGLALALEKPLLAVPTLHAMAYALPPLTGLVCPILDARMGEVYGAAFRRSEDGISCVRPPVVTSIEDFLASVLALSPAEPLLLLGDALAPYGERARLTAPHAVLAPPLYHGPRAAAVGLLAEAMLDQGCAANAALAAPVYLRKSQAEQLRDMAPARAAAP